MTRFGWVVAIAAITACAAGPSTFGLRGGPEIPASEGTVTASPGDNNQNTKIVVVVKHLAVPDRVVPGATSYVVWVQRSADERNAQNVGALQVNDKLDGRLETVTSLKQFLLFITAEQSPSAMAPTGKTLMTTNVVMK
jgi:hypothetical protein